MQLLLLYFIQPDEYNSTIPNRHFKLSNKISQVRVHILQPSQVFTPLTYYLLYNTVGEHSKFEHGQTFFSEYPKQALTCSQRELRSSVWEYVYYYNEWMYLLIS